VLRYHVAFDLPHAAGEMQAAEALDFPNAVTQGFDLPDARLMIASALEDLARALLEEGKPPPVPSDDAQNPDADLIELVPLFDSVCRDDREIATMIRDADEEPCTHHG